MPKIRGRFDGEIRDKRFNLPGVTVSDDCPKCGTIQTKDMGDDYLSYPDVNVPFDFNMYCPACNHEWSFRAILKVALKLIKEDR